MSLDSDFHLERLLKVINKVIEDDISYELGLAITEAHKLDKKDSNPLNG